MALQIQFNRSCREVCTFVSFHLHFAVIDNKLSPVQRSHLGATIKVVVAQVMDIV